MTLLDAQITSLYVETLFQKCIKTLPSSVFHCVKTLCTKKDGMKQRKVGAIKPCWLSSSWSLWLQINPGRSAWQASEAPSSQTPLQQIQACKERSWQTWKGVALSPCTTPSPTSHHKPRTCCCSGLLWWSKADPNALFRSNSLTHPKCG